MTLTVRQTTDSTISSRPEDRPPTATFTVIVSFMNGRSVGARPSIHEILDEKLAGRELGRTGGRCDRPLHVLGTLAFGELAEGGTQSRPIEDRDKTAARTATNTASRRSSSRPARHLREGTAASRPRASVPAPEDLPTRYSITTSTRPASTRVPESPTRLDPARLGALSSFSIFIARRRTRPWTSFDGIAGGDQHTDHRPASARDRLLSLVVPARVARRTAPPAVHITGTLAIELDEQFAPRAPGADVTSRLVTVPSLARTKVKSPVAAPPHLVRRPIYGRRDSAPGGGLDRNRPAACRRSRPFSNVMCHARSARARGTLQRPADATDSRVPSRPWPEVRIDRGRQPSPADRRRAADR